MTKLINHRKTRRFQLVLRLFLANKQAVFGVIVLFLITVFSIFGPFVYSVDPFAIVAPPLTPPGSSPVAPLGTDNIGRDMLAGLMYGGRATLLVGVLSAIICSVVGVTLGALGGYFGGWIDTCAMRATEVVLSIPVILFAMVILTLFSPSLPNVIIAIVVVTWPPMARIARAEFLRLKEAGYIEMAKAIGVPDTEIIWRHILPNAAPPLVVMGTLVVGLAMLMQAGISFLGLADPDIMSWGRMLGDNRTTILSSWYPVLLPGAFISLSVLSINLIGDGLNDVLNPRSYSR